eukprot:gene32470-42065_t
MKLSDKITFIVMWTAFQTSTNGLITPIFSVRHCRGGIVYDIGFNHGQDTLNYLKMNYCVIAVEANPVLAKLGRDSDIFRPYLDLRRLVIVDKLIMEGPSKTVPFYVHLLNDEWSSFHKTDDIEGNDRNCLNDLLLQPSSELPKYVSVEAGSIQNIHLLFKAGYTMFKVVNQEFQGVLGDSTGPFGEFARDALTNMKWQNYAEIVESFKDFEFLHISNHTGLHNACGNVDKNCWYDFHATTTRDFNSSHY